MANSAHLAIDLGAESGRVMVGVFADGGLTLEEAHRFLHVPVDTPNGLRWDVTGIWREIVDGLKQAAVLCASHGWTPVSVGADTWGVDFTLMGRSGVMLGLPSCYRNPSFVEAMALVHHRVPEPEVYAATGIQTMPFNSLYQLDERLRLTPEAVHAAHTLLFMPDVIHWLLSGVMKVERTIASTSQMLDARTGTWNTDLLHKLGLPESILPEPVDPGTEIGTLRESLVETTGLPETLKIIAPGSHDTASAVAAVPYTQREGSAYLSSGTWSLLGVELEDALINDDTNAAEFTNELGTGGRVRFLKNIAGLWLVQQSRAQLREDGLTDEQANYAALTQAAAEAEPLRSVFPANHPSLAAPGKMVDRIRALCAACGEPEPQTPGQIVRSCLDSLALEYRATLGKLEALTNMTIHTLHIVGGGGQNQLLNQLTADATRKRVVVGPYEASAAGNLLVQARASGTIAADATTTELLGSHVVDNGLEPNAESKATWDDAAKRYTALNPDL
ncbi:MAG: rhamnulokinase family protein [Planctomycetota bacterium]